jgi:hypothetical protein
MTPTPVDPQPDPELLDRAATNLKRLLSDLLSKAQAAVAETAGTRSELHQDLDRLLESFVAADRGIVLSALVIATQGKFDEADSPTVGISGGCAGAEGVGVTATQGKTTVTACVTGSLQDGVTGGGFDITSFK